MAYTVKLATIGTVGPTEVVASIADSSGGIAQDRHSVIALQHIGTMASDVGIDFTLSLPVAPFDGQFVEIKNLLPEFVESITFPNRLPANTSEIILTGGGNTFTIDISMTGLMTTYDIPETSVLTGDITVQIRQGTGNPVDLPASSFVITRRTRLVTIDRNGNTIDGRTDDISTMTRLQIFRLTWVGETVGWLAV